MLEACLQLMKVRFLKVQGQELELGPAAAANWVLAVVLALLLQNPA